MTESWTAIVPAKPGQVGKSRLNLEPILRQALATAFTLDTIEACIATPEIGDVLVICADDDLPDLPLGVGRIRDPGHGLNPALSRAAEQAGDDFVIAVLSDLPCLTGPDISRVLASSANHERAFVSDASGIGSTMLYAAGVALRPQFGGRSHAKHRASGAQELSSPELMRCRRDVDTLVDLDDALRMGVGSNTEVLLPTNPSLK
jgi:2-phospho-L-lactate guanylyltransferase